MSCKKEFTAENAENAEKTAKPFFLKEKESVVLCVSAVKGLVV
jgi:hypothetical protein